MHQCTGATIDCMAPTSLIYEDLDARTLSEAFTGGMLPRVVPRIDRCKDARQDKPGQDENFRNLMLCKPEGPISSIVRKRCKTPPWF